MPEYDESVLLEFTSKLYREANLIAFTTTALYGLGGLVVGIVGSFGIAEYTHTTESYPIGPVVSVVALFGLLIGAIMGRERGFRLRLEAQQILVQAQIEKNTRKSGISS